MVSSVVCKSCWHRKTSASGLTANCARCEPMAGEVRATCNARLALINASIFVEIAFMGDSSRFTMILTA